MKKTGFTLIESVVALLIMSVAMASLFKTQGELVLGTSTIHGYVERLFLIKNYFIKARQNRWHKTTEIHKEVLDDPEVTLEYKTQIPSQGIVQSLKNLVIERVDATWQGNRSTLKESLITFKFI